MVEFDKDKKAKLQMAFERHQGPEFDEMRRMAMERGFRLAEVWERELLDRSELYSWRGTLWVKVGENASIKDNGGVDVGVSEVGR